jgi:hypothetical protein
MEHNLVVGKTGSREKMVSEALKLAQDGPKLGYIPAIPEVLWSIAMLQAGEIDSVIFRAPRNTGVFPYVCTFPGHGSIMFGAMYVTNGVMPPLAIDENVPEHRRTGVHEVSNDGQVSGHPYQPTAPFLYRVLMPDASPAAIAVCLPHEINYCWDAGSCRLRYAWSGEFLDLMDYWTVKGELYAKILGSIFFRDQTSYPFQLTPQDPSVVVDFKGYRLVKGYPEFHYMINGVEVFELLTETDGGIGLNRRFRFQKLADDLWFTSDDRDGMIYHSDKGIWYEKRLKISPEEATDFTITMIKLGL